MNIGIKIKKIYYKTIQDKKELNIYNIRETIFFNTKLCNNFRITVALTILEYFKPKKWLDISAGWGDRLLSAIFYKIKLYVSCDPNLDLHPCYDNIIETFVPESKRKNFKIYKNGFLEAPITDKNFDIVFSSPPFFTLEIYSDFNENSVKQFATEKLWCDNFFVKSLIKAYNLLKKDGYMILYMGGSDYIMNKMHLLINIMDYKGQIYFYEKFPRGIYVWKKIRNNKIVSLE
jgi:16S rRNA G966 N2-methylase RsmD